MRWGQRYNHGTCCLKTHRFGDPDINSNTTIHFSNLTTKISPKFLPFKNQGFYTHTFVVFQPASCKRHPPKRSITDFTPFLRFGTAEASMKQSFTTIVGRFRRLDHQKKTGAKTLCIILMEVNSNLVFHDIPIFKGNPWTQSGSICQPAIAMVNFANINSTQKTKTKHLFSGGFEKSEAFLGHTPHEQVTTLSSLPTECTIRS